MQKLQMKILRKFLGRVLGSAVPNERWWSLLLIVTFCQLSVLGYLFKSTLDVHHKTDTNCIFAI